MREVSDAEADKLIAANGGQWAPEDEIAVTKEVITGRISRSAARIKLILYRAMEKARNPETESDASRAIRLARLARKEAKRAKLRKDRADCAKNIPPRPGSVTPKSPRRARKTARR